MRSSYSGVLDRPQFFTTLFVSGRFVGFLHHFVLKKEIFIKIIR